jgi:hypothetical protein
MIHHVIYFQLQPGVDKPGIEELVRTTRSQLLKIPEVLSVRSGRNIDPESQWQFYFSIEVDSLEKLRATCDNPFYLRLMEKTLAPLTCGSLALDYELDPSKDLKYS